MAKHPNNQKRQKQLALKRGSSAPAKFENRLEIKDIYFGTIDATDELDVGGPEAAEDFFNTFYIPANVSIEKLLSGEKFFVYGLKGTGKTSLLRYLDEYIDRNALSNTSPELFMFSREFPREIYDDVRKAFLEGKDPTVEDRSAIYRDLDYEDVWIYIILKRISEVAASKDGRIFEKDKNLDRFTAYMNSISGRETRQKLFRFLPNVRSGKVSLSANPSADFDIDFDDESSREVTFHRYTARALELFCELKPTPGGSFYLMFDEIDPRTASGVLFELDCILIRDLIVAIRRINTLNLKHGRGVYLLAAIRSEILEKVRQLGKEIHKRLEQFGYSMNWGDSGRASIEHPLIKMICSKIAYSERKSGITLMPQDIDEVVRYIWPRYFRKNKSQQLDPKELLDWTWYRPRDFIRLFEICKEIDGNSEEISESLINRGNKRYSNRSWAEIEAQMTLFIDPFSMEGIEKALTRFKREFTLSEFESRLSDFSDKYTNSERLNRKYKAADIVSHLYKNGAIGNLHGTRLRFVFRGDAEPDFEGKLYVHRGLLPRFAISLRR